MSNNQALRRFYLDAVYGRAAFDAASAARHGFDPQAFAEVRRKCLIRGRPTCRYCTTVVPEADCVVTVTYWQSMWDIAHAACEAAGRKEEAYECQCIDSDCNDCAHFRREERRRYGFAGHCLKLDEADPRLREVRQLPPVLRAPPRYDRRFSPVMTPENDKDNPDA